MTLLDGRLLLSFLCAACRSVGRLQASNVVVVGVSDAASSINTFNVVWDGNLVVSSVGNKVTHLGK